MKKVTISLAEPLWYLICALLLVAGENGAASQIQKQLSDMEEMGKEG